MPITKSSLVPVRFSDEWVTFYLSQAIHYSTRSKDPSTKVGCILVDDKKIPVGWGTNGFSRHSSDSPDLFNNREEKYKRVIHAEENAIYNATRSVEGCTAFLTHPPCVGCCNKLSQNGIMEVYFIKPVGEFASRWNLDEIREELNDLKMKWVECIIPEDLNPFADSLKQLDKLRGVETSDKE